MLCPSYPQQAATLEIGVRDADGTIRFHATPIALSPEVRARRAEAREADSRARFAGPCATSACSNWGGGCRLGRFVAEDAASEGRPCAISDRCRWISENGPSVCQRCPVVTYRPAQIT